MRRTTPARSTRCTRQTEIGESRPPRCPYENGTEITAFCFFETVPSLRLMLSFRRPLNSATIAFGALPSITPNLSVFLAS